MWGLHLVLGMWYCGSVREKKMCTSKSQASCLLLGTLLEPSRVGAKLFLEVGNASESLKDESLKDAVLG